MFPTMLLLTPASFCFRVVIEHSLSSAGNGFEILALFVLLFPYPSCHEPARPDIGSLFHPLHLGGLAQFEQVSAVFRN